MVVYGVGGVCGSWGGLDRWVEKRDHRVGLSVREWGRSKVVSVRLGRGWMRWDGVVGWMWEGSGYG